MDNNYKEDGGMGGSITASILQNELTKSLQGKMANHPPVTASSQSNKSSQISQIQPNDTNIVPGAESLLINLFEVRDSLIDTFSSLDIHSTSATKLTDNINKIGASIISLGGSIDDFDPMEHVSGLQMPNLQKNASRVIETTKQCYSLGQIEGEILSNDKIVMTFSGSENNTLFKAKAKIGSYNGWSGNEAIDYIYTPGAGKISVKAFQDGRWVDKSNSYSISWELTEEPKTASEQKNEKKENIVEEDQKEITNNLDNDDFPIEEK